MEKVVSSDLYSSGANYLLLGQEKQTLQLVLMPGQSIHTKREALLYTSANVTSKKVKLGCCGKFCSYFPSLRARAKEEAVNMMLCNDTSTIGYVGLQLMKGKIIVIDNKVEATRNMVVKNKYVIAHSGQVTMRPNRSRAARFRNRDQLNGAAGDD